MLTTAKDRIVAENAGEEPQENDQTLVEKARDGDEAAFYELVRRHRAQACGIARTLMRDAHMAEDIVQEALVRAFLQLGTLADSGRFLPWFHRIVRTQAWMKLRRGGLYRKEMPMTGMISVPDDADSGYWENVDRILFHLRLRSDQRCRLAEDPAEDMLRKELLDSLAGMLTCLNRREREIFEAHFWGELTPKEIAECFRTTPGYVYTSISRAKAKLQNERLRLTVLGYTSRRRMNGQPVRRILDASIIHFH